MKSTANRLFFIVGAFILALMVVDSLIRMNRSAFAEYGQGSGPWVEANGAPALFLVGLVSGVVLGIGLFFASLVWRERKLREEGIEDDFEALLAEIECMEEDGEEDSINPLFVEDAPPEDFAETRDPWEKPADWWKSGDDD